MADETKKVEETKATEVKVEAPKEPAKEAPRAIAPVMPEVSELDLARKRADTMEVKYLTSDTVADIELRITDSQSKNTKSSNATHAGISSKAQDEAELRQKMFEENMCLVRCRITNMNPNKADLASEMHTVSNKYLGAVTRVIPYGTQEDGWHVERILLNHLKGKMFQQIRVMKGPNGQQLPQTKWVKEFAIEELPPLSMEDLRVLANQQAASEGRGI
jgi:hypothetical protein